MAVQTSSMPDLHGRSPRSHSLEKPSQSKLAKMCLRVIQAKGRELATLEKQTQDAALKAKDELDLLEGRLRVLEGVVADEE